MVKISKAYYDKITANIKKPAVVSPAVVVPETPQTRNYTYNPLNASPMEGDIAPSIYGQNAPETPAPVTRQVARPVTQQQTPIVNTAPDYTSNPLNVSQIFGDVAPTIYSPIKPVEVIKPVDTEAEQYRSTLSNTQQKLAEQTQALVNFSVDTPEDVARETALSDEVKKLQIELSANTADIKSYLIPKKYADVKRGTTPIETWNANIDVATLSKDKSKARTDALDNPTPQNIKLADTLNKTYDEYIAKNREAMYNADGTLRGNVITQVFASAIPGILDLLASQAPAAVGALAVGAVTGGVGVVPTFQALGALTAAKNTYESSRGSAYDGLIALGVTADKAKTISNNQALNSSLYTLGVYALGYKVLGFGALMGSVSKVGTGVVADLIAQPGKEFLVQTTLQKIIATLSNYGVFVLTGAAYGAAQQNLTIAGQKEGLGSARTVTAEQDLQSEIQAAKSGAQTAAIFGGLAMLGTAAARAYFKPKVVGPYPPENASAPALGAGETGMTVVPENAPAVGGIAPIVPTAGQIVPVNGQVVPRVNAPAGNQITPIQPVNMTVNTAVTPTVAPATNIGRNAVVPISTPTVAPLSTTPVAVNMVGKTAVTPSATPNTVTQPITPTVKGTPVEGKVAGVEVPVKVEQKIVKDSVGNAVTPEQSEYFKDSKAVNKEGSLIKVYHGTNATFTEFDITKSGSNTNNEGVFGKGFYFTEDSKLANNYNRKDGNYAKDGSGQVIQAYLNLKNPFQWNSIKTSEQLDALAKQLKMVGKLKYNRLEDYKGIHAITDAKITREFTEKLKSSGYDGVEYHYPNGGATEYVAFYSEQIKSVDNKTPINSPNIMDVSPTVLEKISIAKTETLEQEFFGHSLAKIDLQLFAKKFNNAQARLLERFTREKEAIRSLAKDRQVAALDTLSKKYDAKIDRLNSMLDSEKYTNFWKNELDKKELRDRIDTLRADKNAKIEAMKQEFSQRLAEKGKQYTIKKNEALKKFREQVAQTKKEQRANSIERKARAKKLKQLKSLDTGKMRPEYRDRINALLEPFDLSAQKHTAHFLKSLQFTQDFLDANPDFDMPQYKIDQLKLLSKKTISQMTKDEFENLYETVMYLANLEKMKDTYIMNGKYRAAEKVNKEAVTNVLRNREMKTDPTYIDTNKPEFAKGLNLKGFYLQHLNPETMVIISDQKLNGIIKEIVFDGMYEGHSNELAYEQEAYKIFKPFFKKSGTKLRNWSRSIDGKLKNSDLVEIPISKQAKQTITKIRITKAERVEIYLAEKDPDAKRTIMKNGFAFKTNPSQIVKLTEADFDTISNGMSPEEKEFAGLYTQYNTDFSPPRINKVHLTLNGWELIQNKKGHITITRHPDYLNKDYIKSRGRDRSLNASIEGMGRWKERNNSSMPLILDDAFVSLAKDISATASYVGYSEPLRNAKMLLRNPDLIKAYRQSGMYPMHEELVKYVGDLETQSTDLGYIDKIGYTILNKFASAVLGLNPSPILKQLSSYILETNEIPAALLLKAQTTNGKQTLAEIEKYSPILTDRVTGNVSLELGEIGKVASLRSMFGNFHDIPQRLTKGMVAVDRQITLKTWEAAKMQLKQQNPTIEHEELMIKTARRTEEILRHTNQAATIHDRSAIGREKGFWTKSMTMFTSQTNVMFNAVVRATTEFNFSDKTPKDWKKLIGTLLTVWVLANMFEQSIDHLMKKLKGQKDNWNPIMDIVEGVAAEIYLVGKMFTAFKSKLEFGKFYGYDVTTPPLQIMDNVINVFSDFATGIGQFSTQEVYKSGEHKGTLKWVQTRDTLINEIFSLLSKFMGLPYDTVKKWTDIGLNVTQPVPKQ